MKNEKKILIAEDDIAAADTLKEYLQFHGFSCDIENSGKEVPSRITPETGIVILDINLADGPTGLQLLSDIKKSNPDIQTLIVTGDSIPENRLQSLRLGADFFFAKPIDLALLLAHLNKSMKTKMA